MVSGGVADPLPIWLLVVGHGSVICDEETSACAGSSLQWTCWAAIVEYHEYHHDGVRDPPPAICRFCLLVVLCVYSLCWKFCHVTCALFRLAQTTRLGATFVHPNSSHWRASAGGGETSCYPLTDGLVWFGLRPLEADATEANWFLYPFLGVVLWGLQARVPQQGEGRSKTMPMVLQSTVSQGGAVLDRQLALETGFER